MPSPNDHITQWLHNRAFLTEIRPDYRDWIVTAAFYTALHAVDTLLAFDKVTVTNHESRNRTLARVNRYDKIYDRFDPLYKLARTIRYLADATQWVPLEQIQPKIIERHLYPIEQSVQKLIGRDLGLPALKIQTSSIPS